MLYLGLGKTLFNSSACLIRENNGRPDPELILTERITRKKASGAWPEAAIGHLKSRLDGQTVRIAEDRDVVSPALIEEHLNSRFPFYAHLERTGLAQFSRHFNPEIGFVTHHRCHAMAATFMSPFEKSVILVLDGAGSKAADFAADSPETAFFPTTADRNIHEECSIYLQDCSSVRCVYKAWQKFQRGTRNPLHHYSEGTGTLYEKSAEFIFNSSRAAGKVMGLAPFGKVSPIGGGIDYLESLPWALAFSGKDKTEWESSGRIPFFADIAASVQANFEKRLTELTRMIHERFPEYENLILAGGCALNCTNNMKLVRSGLFREIYVPPFPGDESIALGAAAELYFSESGARWSPFMHEEQHGYFGPTSFIPEEKIVRQVFEGFQISRPGSIAEHTAQILERGGIIGWFQGRSESGPRALGNRSIIARPDQPGLKDRLNREIKFRETFRPYGCSCVHEKAHEYFDIPAGFNNPYMSFAVNTRSESFERLREVTHIDGTSRIQTVRRGQNARFHELLMKFGAKTGLYCLLNTSLNVMGEPIVETAEDARRFLLNVPVDGIAIGDFYIRKS